MFSVGALIWISLRPLLRLAIGVGCGFVITKADMFPPVAARGASQVILNVMVPALMFSKIVPAFNKSNIQAFGPLFLVASLYELIGIVIAWLTKQVFWVPHRFRYGLLVAGGWGNVGDIPISVVLSVTGMAPFQGTDDQNLSVAYLSVFMFVFIVSLFPMGGHRWIAQDYVGPDVEPCDVKAAMKAKRRRMLCLQPLPVPDVEKSVEIAQEKQEVFDEDARKLRGQATTVHEGSTIVELTPEESPSSRTQPSKEKANVEENVTCPDTSISFQSPSLTRAEAYRSRLITFFKSLLSAPSLSILISFPVALIPKLKGLFVYVPEAQIPNAPDGQPPLSFIMDTASFMGAASVPLGLVCLGSALARLKIPHGRWGTLPVGAISSIALGKLLVMPVLGVVIVRGLVRGGLIPEKDKVLQFVCIFCSCLPTATTQVYLTQVYSGTGEAEHLSAFLIPQYILMFFSMTALTAYTLHLLF